MDVNPIKCAFCKDIVETIDKRYQIGNRTIDEIEQMIKRICSLLLSKPKRETCLKVDNNIDELKNQAKNLFGKKLITPQTGSNGREVKRLYIEETCEIEKEFYLSCLIDRESSKIAFISSAAGGMDIEKISETNPEKITTTKVDYAKTLSQKYIEQIIKPFNLTAIICFN